MNKHLIWAVSLIIITLLLCVTTIYMSHNPITIEIKTDLRADDNSKDIINSALLYNNGVGCSINTTYDNCNILGEVSK